MSPSRTRLFGSNTAKATLCAVSAMLLFSAGCEELSARRGIQKGDKAYGQARYTEAVKHYEEALEKSNLEIGQHNAGLAYYRLFTPGGQEAENKTYAEKATEHFLAYLESNPNDKRVIDLLTQIWLDSDQYDKALDYWKKVLANNPNDPGVLARLADVNRAAGNYEEAIGWLHKRVDVETDDGGKVKAYMDIANVQYSRLTNSSLVDEERLAVADSALAALNNAIKINPDNAQLYGLTAVVFQFRAQGHGASWARLVEGASQRHFNLVARKQSSVKKPSPEKKPKPDEQK